MQDGNYTGQLTGSDLLVFLRGHSSSMLGLSIYHLIDGEDDQENTNERSKAGHTSSKGYRGQKKKISIRIKQLIIL